MNFIALLCALSAWASVLLYDHSNPTPALLAAFGCLLGVGYLSARSDQARAAKLSAQEREEEQKDMQNY